MRYARFAAVTAAFLLSAGLLRPHRRRTTPTPTSSCDLFGDVFEQVRADYVEEVTDQQLIEDAINGMLNRARSRIRAT